MAVGVPTVTVEIEWTVGTWTDVSTDLAFEQGTSGTFGRPSEFDDVSAGVWRVVLRNDTGTYTPDNPLSTYYPNVVENRRLRVTVTPPGGSAYVRFLGYITSIEPSFPTDAASVGIVSIEAADLLAVMNRRALGTGYVEQANFTARLNGSWNDTWTFDDSVATVFENLGERGTRASAATAVVKQANTAVGTAAAGTVDDLMVDGSMTLTPSGIVGPIVQVDLSGTPGQIDFFVKIPPTGLGVGTTGLVVADFWTATAEVFSLRVQARTATSVDFCFYDNTGVFSNYTHSAAGQPDQAVDTDTWVKVTLIPYLGTDTLIAFNDSSTLTQMVGFDLDTVTKIFFGGYVANGKAGKQTYCLSMSLAGLNIEGSSHGVYYYFALGTPPVADGGTEQRWQELCGAGSQVLGSTLLTDVSVTSGSAVITSASAQFTSADIGKGVFVAYGPFLSDNYFAANTTIVSVQSSTQVTLSNVSSGTDATTWTIIGPAIIGSDVRDIVRHNTSGQTLAEALQLHARTVGGTMWVSNAGIPTLILADAMRSTTPIATVHIEDDAIASGLELRRSIDQAPTRVTATSPVGHRTIVDTVAEAAGYRRELSIECASPSDADLYALASYYLTSTKSLRISRLSVNLAGSKNNLYASFLGSLRPGARVRISGLPSATFGVTYVDIFVQGWTEEYDVSSATITFDCAPADAPCEAAFDDTEYGRFAADGTITLATTVTSSATTIKAGSSTSALSAFSTSAADYPLDISLNGERITLPAVPSSGTRTNFVANPSFEVGTTAGWLTSFAGFTTSTASVVSTPVYLGTKACKVVWPNATALSAIFARTHASLTIGATYNWSIYAWVPIGSPDVKLILADGGGTSITYSRQVTTGTNGAWIRLGVTWVASAVSHTPALVNLTASTSGQYFYCDAALFESGSGGIGSYFDGSNGGSWVGTVNNSNSTQATQQWTSVTRGVAPSVARAHTAGEDVDVWHAAALSL